MEKFSNNSYTDSNGSSLRCREIDSVNPPPLDDQNKQQPDSYKVKLMCSYGGKIQPRLHDNQLAYVNGDTKILSVDRGIRFLALASKLSDVCGIAGDVSFKYQLPGEDLDALISVTNDDDLEHMMHEYDRLLRVSSKPARMRLFLFSAFSPSGEFGSQGLTQTNRDRLAEAVNTDLKVLESENSVTVLPNSADFLFRSEKVAAPPPPTVEVKLPITVALEPPLFNDQRVIQPDHGVNPMEIQRQMQEVQRMQIRDQEQQQYQLPQQQHEPVYRRKNSEDSLMETGGFNPPPYVQIPAPPPTIPQTIPQAPPMAFWQGNHNQGGVISTTPQGLGLPEQPIYVIPSPYTATRYHAPPPPQQGVMRPITIAQGNQGGGYHTPVQRLAPPPQPPVGTKVQQPPPLVSSGPPPPQYSAVTLPQQVVGLPDPSVYTQVTKAGVIGQQVYYTEAPPPQYNGIGIPVTSISELRNGANGNLVAMNIAPKDSSQKSDSTV